MEKVEVIYIDEAQRSIQLYMALKPKATVGDVLQESGLWSTHPETKNYPVGIYSKPVSLDMVPKSGDRIEIYRPLTCDPKEKRRQRAK